MKKGRKMKKDPKKKEQQSKDAAIFYLIKNCALTKEEKQKLIRSLLKKES